MPIRVFSYGGGVQSTAALVLAAQDKINFPTFLFANVGDDSENPDTIEYFNNYARQYAADHGIEMVELWRVVSRGPHKGERETIYGRVTRPGSKSQVIPGYLKGSGAPGNRSCTADFKIRVIARYQRDVMGATAENPAITGLGISIDEYQRMRTDSNIAWQRLEYPLIDLRLSRVDCHRIIKEAGLPTPPKSACFFCPYQSMNSWRRLKASRPDLFERAITLEQSMLEMSAQRNDAIYLTRKLRPLDQVVGDQADMFDGVDDTCESGFCMT